MAAEKLAENVDLLDLPDFQEADGAPPELRQQFGGLRRRVQLPARKLVTLTQMRPDRNPRISEITESINAQGMINDINVACVDRRTFEDYVNFTNALWGVQDESAHYDDFRLSNGMYLLVVAGHTRLAAALALSDQAAEHYALENDMARKDVNDAPKISATLYEKVTPEEILAIQLAENLHYAPSGERRAMAIIESYEYGKLQGRWSSIKEFAVCNEGLVSESMLRDALAFSGLPPEMRTFVFHGTVSYTSAVLLGRAVPHIGERFSEAVELGEATEADRAEYIRHTVMAKMTELHKKGLRGVALKTHMKTWTDSFRPANRMAARQQALDFALYSTEEQVQMAIAQARAEYVYQLDQLVRDEHEERVRLILEAHRAAGLDDEALALIQERAVAHASLVRSIGATANNIPVESVKQLW